MITWREEDRECVASKRGEQGDLLGLVELPRHHNSVGLVCLRRVRAGVLLLLLYFYICDPPRPKPDFAGLDTKRRHEAN